MKKLSYSISLNWLLFFLFSTNLTAQSENIESPLHKRYLAPASINISTNEITHDGGAPFEFNNTEGGSFLFQNNGSNLLNIQETGRLILTHNANNQAFNILVNNFGQLQFQPNGIAGNEIALTIDDDNRNVGIGTAFPAKRLHVVGFQQTDVDGTLANNSTFNSAHNYKISGEVQKFTGIIMRYTEDNNLGVNLLARNYGGINIAEPIGLAYEEIAASRFDVESFHGKSERSKIIKKESATNYMQQIRKIETVAYWRKAKNNRQKSAPRLGVIAKSLPIELQVEMDERADGSTQKTKLGISLSDWLGLVTIGVKENDRRILSMESKEKQLIKKNAQLATENDRLKEKLEALENKITALATTVDQLMHQANKKSEKTNYELQLQKRPSLAQNHPNPFHENTLVNYFLPDNAQQAYIQVSNIEGTVLGKVTIQTSGHGQVNIKASTYPAGTYYYSLVVDGEIYETKKMVLTK